MQLLISIYLFAYLLTYLRISITIYLFTNLRIYLCTEFLLFIYWHLLLFFLRIVVNFFDFGKTEQMKSLVIKPSLSRHTLLPSYFSLPHLLLFSPSPPSMPQEQQRTC